MKKIEINSLEELLSFNIKYYRYLNGFSQEKLAELSSLAPTYISDIERGRHMPTIKNISKLAMVLNIEPHVLFMNNVRDEEILNKMNYTRQYNQYNLIKDNNGNYKIWQLKRPINI